MVSLGSSVQTTIFMAIWFQVVTIAIVSALVLAMAVRRRIRNRRANQLKEIYSNLLVGELISAASETKQGAYLEFVNDFERSVFQTVLLDLMASVTGVERDHLIARYRQMGFLSKDVVLLKSRFWWQRLNGIVHIGALQDPETASILLPMIKDRHSLVASAALLSLSCLNHPLNNPRNWMPFPETVLNQRSLLCKVLLNTAKQDAEWLNEDWLKENVDPRLREACIQVLIGMRSAESVKYLCLILENRTDLQLTTTFEILRALKEIGDPSAIKSIGRFQSHPDLRLRQIAKEALISIPNFGEAS